MTINQFLRQVSYICLQLFNLPNIIMVDLSMIKTKGLL